MAERVFISIGSNLGQRARNCLRAVELLTEGAGVEQIRKSSLYETEPWGKAGQPGFINCVVEVTTTLEPRGLLAVLKEIEEEMGRRAGERWGPRTVDLDIVFFGDRVIAEEGLTVPHPRAHERAFVLAPLAEIAPRFVHPVIKKSVKELSEAARGGVKLFEGEK